jgi:hypothetical protein
MYLYKTQNVFEHFNHHLTYHGITANRKWTRAITHIVFSQFCKLWSLRKKGEK